MKIGVQMYSLRNFIPQTGIERTLDTVRQCGFTCIEPICDDYGVGYEAVGKLMRKNGLSACSAHLPVEVIGDHDKLTKLRDAYGFSVAVIPYIPREIFYDRAAMGKVVEDAAQNASRLGLKLAYHNHNFEFDEENALVDLAKAHPSLKLQPDVFWLKASGIQPMEFLTENAPYIELIHMKEFARSVEDESPVVGDGTTDAPSILRFAAQQKHESIILEYEKPCLDDVTYLKKSYAYMKEHAHE